MKRNRKIMVGVGACLCAGVVVLCAYVGSPRMRAERLLSSLEDQPSWLVRLIGERKRTTPGEVAPELAKLGPPAVDVLIEALNRDSDGVRYAAILALGEIRDERAVGPLLRVLRPPPGSRTFSGLEKMLAARALAEFGPAATGPLVDSLGQGRGGVIRLDVTKILGAIGPPALDQLERALPKGNTATRKEVCQVLAMIRHPRSARLLWGALADEDASVRWWAVTGTGALGYKEEDHRLIPVLGDPDARVRAEAAEVLGMLRSTKAIPALTNSLEDADANVERHALMALARIGTPEAVEAIFAAVRRGAVEEGNLARAITGGKPSSKPLVAALEDRNVLVRLAAAAGLWGLGDERARDLLIAASEDKQSGTRMFAEACLIELEYGMPDEPAAWTTLDGAYGKSMNPSVRPPPDRPFWGSPPGRPINHSPGRGQ